MNPLIFVTVSQAASLEEVWAANSAAIARASPVPVVLSAADFATLRGGQVVARRTESAQGMFATGAVLVDVAIEMAWITIQDAPHDPGSRVRSVWLDGAPVGIRRTYNTMDLPFPLADRQWVLELTANRPLFDATGGAVWQRTWHEVDPSLAPAPDPGAEWLPEARGAWTLLATDQGTVMLFSIRTVLGGAIPAGLTNSWAVPTLRTSLAHFAERAKTMSAHYGPSHDRVLTPAGTTIASR